MAGQTPKKNKSSRAWLLGCGLGILILFTALVVAGVYVYSLTRKTLAETPLSTTLNMPQNGEQVEVSQLLTIQAQASGSKGVSRVEVYADGALILAQEAAEKSEPALAVEGIWSPAAAGRHILIARGYGARGTFADSEIVNIIVTQPPENLVINVDSIKKDAKAPNPSLADIASVYGMTPEELARRNPELSGTSPTAPLPPGTRIDAPRLPDYYPPPSPSSPPGPSTPPGPSSPPSPPLGAPAPPTNLGATADCTSATLTWTDSLDEASYRLYRLDPGAVRPFVVANSLPGNTISYRDTFPAPGIYRYQVASVRGSQESLSLMITAASPASCTVPGTSPGTVTDLVLTIATVDTDTTYEGVYCYLSINGQPYERIPAGTGLLSPESGNNLYYNLTRLPGGGRYNLSGQSFDSPVTLQGECVGRQGPLAPGLGIFTINHPQADWDGRMRSANGDRFHFSYCLGPASTPCTPTIPGAPTSPGLYLDLGILIDSYLNLPPPTNVAISRSTPADCSSIAGLVERLACSLERIIAASTGLESWNTITWNWQGTTLFPESSLTSYTVVRTLVNPATGNQFSILWDVNRQPDGTLPKISLSDNRDVHCGTRVEYRVRANQAGRQSALSDTVSFNAPNCPQEANLVITFDTLKVENAVDSNEGYFLGVGPLINYTLEGTVDISLGALNNPTFVSLIPPSRNYSFSNGTYPFAWFPLTRGNILRTNIGDERQSVTYEMQFMEWDTNWAGQWQFDTLERCNKSQIIGPMPITDWSEFNQTFTYNCAMVQGNFTWTVHVTGSPVR